MCYNNLLVLFYPTHKMRSNKKCSEDFVNIYGEQFKMLDVKSHNVPVISYYQILFRHKTLSVVYHYGRGICSLIISWYLGNSAQHSPPCTLHFWVLIRM